LLQTSVHDGYLAHTSSLSDPSPTTHRSSSLHETTTKRIGAARKGKGKISTIVAQLTRASSNSKNTVTTTSRSSDSSDSYPHPEEESSSSSSNNDESSSISSSSVDPRRKKVTHIHTHNHDHDTHTEAAHNHVHDDKEYAQMSECKRLKEQFGIKPGEDWGRAPSDVQSQWNRLQCDDPFLGPQHHETKPRNAGGTGFGGRSTNHLVLDHDVTHNHVPKGTIRIGFLTPMTTSHSRVQNYGQLVFWSVLWQSFLKVSKGSLQNEKDPYWYTFFIGYDDGDPILSQHDQQLAIIKHFDEQLENADIPTHKVGIRFYSMDDTVHAPSWGVSHLAQAAVDLGIDYLYQVNDDVELLTSGWEDTLIGLLKQNNNFGATGPKDVSNNRILTQSFVHATHVRIFDFYFAEPFKNWYSDDWLSEVYGSHHTFRSHPVEVRHHAKEQRYPTLEAKHLLSGEVEKGRITIRKWLQQNLPDVQL